MSVGRTSSNQIEQQVNEPREPYANNIFWNTDHQLPPRDVVEGNIFPQDVSDTMGDVNVALTNWSRTESTTFEAGWGLVPTPLPGTNDVPLSLGWEFDWGEGGEANLQGTWEGEGTATSSMAPSEVQYESTTSSESVFGSRQAEKRRSRKKEDGGWQRKYTHAPNAILSAAAETRYGGIYGINMPNDS